QRQNADDADERRARSANAAAAGRGVLSRAEAAEGADGADPSQRRMARHDVHAVDFPADTALPAVLVRQVQAAVGSHYNESAGGTLISQRESSARHQPSDRDSRRVSALG